MIGRLAAHRRQTSRRLVLRWLNQCIERLWLRFHVPTAMLTNRAGNIF
jgi:hypothetical protein